MKIIIYCVFIFWVFNVSAQSKTFYLIRHAEKADDGSKDPVLTSQGQQRAQNIARMLASANIDSVYATDYQRTQMTAQPLAEFLGTDVISYDPRALVTFAEKIKLQDGNALIVGHSNTTPMLTHLLSGQPVVSLDETDFDHVFQVSIDGDEASLTQFKSLPSQVTEKPSQLKPIQANFFNGELRFNVLFKEEVIGTAVHTFRQVEQSYELSEKNTIEKMDIDTAIMAIVDSNTLAPKYLSVSGSMGGPVSIELQWGGHEVKGYSEKAREPFKYQGKLEVDKALSPTTLERSSAIMLAHLMPVTKAAPLLVRWFDAKDGDDRLINVLYHGEEQVTVPAGTFETHKIEYSGGAPSQYFWVDKKQAKVVKVEVVKSPWRYELLDYKVFNH